MRVKETKRVSKSAEGQGHLSVDTIAVSSGACHGLNTSVPGAQGTGLASCDAAPRPSPGQHAHGLEPPVSAESRD